MKRRLLKALTALVLAVALAAVNVPVILADAPAGYNEYEFEKLNAFLETPDEYGVKNGVKINPDYVSGDPATWGTYYDYIEEMERDCFVWRQIGGELRVVEVICYDFGLVGELDVSGFTELIEVNCEKNFLTGLDVTNCPKLQLLSFRTNVSLGDQDLTGSPELQVVWGWEAGLTSIDVSNCPLLERLYLDDNPELGELDLTNNPRLDTLDAMNCGLSTVDLSNCPLLVNVTLLSNPLTELDVSNCPELTGGRYAVQGNGSFSYCWYSWNQGFVVINGEGEDFLGWYDGSGALITSDTGYDLPGTNIELAIARFEGAEQVLGDADGNGRVETVDAVLTLRYLLDLDTAGHIDTIEANCDINGDGVINVNDAVLILRCALGVM